MLNLFVLLLSIIITPLIIGAEQSQDTTLQKKTLSPIHTHSSNQNSPSWSTKEREAKRILMETGAKVSFILPNTQSNPNNASLSPHSLLSENSDDNPDKEDIQQEDHTSSSPMLNKQLLLELMKKKVTPSE